MLARVESIDKFHNNVIAFDCPDEEFRSEAWHAIVRRYDQRNMSGKKSAHAALISNISEKDRAKDVEQFDDILRTFTNEMDKFENRFGKIRDEEKMLAVKKLMPESLLNFRCRVTTMSHRQFIVALENIIVDKVATVPSARSRKHDTSAPMEIGMTDNASQEGDQRIIDIALQAVCKGTGKGKWDFGKGQNWNEKSVKRRQGWRKEILAERQRQERRQRARERWQGRNQNVLGRGARQRHIAAWYAIDEDDRENVKESDENEEDPQAWYLLEESENEQWQEVISRRSKQRAKKVNQASLL